MKPLRPNPASEPELRLLTHLPPSSPAAASAAMAGSLAASLLAMLTADHIELAASEKAEDELRAIRDRCLSLRRDLVAMVARLDESAAAVTRSQVPTRLPSQHADDRLRALLFASEVPLRLAESCHALLNLAMKTLGKTGVRGIGEVGTAAALAFAGVVGGIVTARGYLAGIPAGSGMGVGTTRKRAERIFREAEALRTQITDRVRQHLP